MDSENTYTGYNDKKNEIPWLRMIITAFVLAVAIFLVLLLIKSCSKTSLRDDLQKSVQKYYEKYSSDLPKEVGECYSITLDTLKKSEFIDNEKYSTCDETNTYVNVCYLENSKYNYSATLSCKSETTKYGVWQDGTIKDLEDGTDVRFMFIGEQKKLVEEETNVSETKYYYPNNTTDVLSVNRYYTKSPTSDYTLMDGETKGYKWYTTSSVKSYWNNGEYSATAPSGYINKDSQNNITKYSEAKPESASYRTISETTLYRYKKVAVPYKFLCVVPGTSSKNSPTIASPNHCALNKQGFTQVEKAYYTCDGGKTDTAYGTVCKDYTNWSNEACTTSVSKGIECQSKTGYKYVDTVYKWYKNDTVRKYYPSNSSNAGGENTYFTSSPISGAIKDESTEAQVYKFYKVEKTSDINMVEKWIDVTNGYVNLNDLVSIFNKLEYNVNNLTDIKSIDDIRYQIKMQYRNVEE